MHKDKRFSYIFIFSTLFIVVILFFFISNTSLIASPSESKNYNSAGKQISPNYFEYSEDLFDKRIKEGKVVLFFSAPWCGTCSELNRELEEESQRLSDGITVLKINFDTEKDLKREFNVLNQHTLVQIDKDRNEIIKWVGGDLEAINKNLQ